MNFKIIDIGELPKDKIIDCNTPILYLYFNYALYIDFKNNCSAIVNGAASEDGDV
jgi:restriction endonuclease S subunit